MPFGAPWCPISARTNLRRGLPAVGLFRPMLVSFANAGAFFFVGFTTRLSESLSPHGLPHTPAPQATLRLPGAFQPHACTAALRTRRGPGASGAPDAPGAPGGCACCVRRELPGAATRACAEAEAGRACRAARRRRQRRARRSVGLLCCPGPALASLTGRLDAPVAGSCVAERPGVCAGGRAQARTLPRTRAHDSSRTLAGVTPSSSAARRPA